MTYSELSYESVLRVVHTWPAAKRYSLIQDLLKTIEPCEEEGERPDTLRQALGLLATDQPAPSDKDVARWLHERRTGKYRHHRRFGLPRRRTLAFAHPGA